MRRSTVLWRRAVAPKGRTVPNVQPLKLRPPIEPRVSDVQTPDDHPLWQFFGPDRSWMRKASDLENIGDSWSIPQLRRKSVDDLHTLWYVCLKEMNRLDREIRLVKQWMSEPSKDTHAPNQDVVFEDVREKVQTTMWRIRHVLSERYHAFRRVERDIGNEYPRIFDQFQADYLGAPDNADSEVTGWLERFQYAFYGINPGLEDNFPEPRVLRGLYVIARLKLRRYGAENPDVTSINDIREAFLLWTAEHSPAGVSDATESILSLRKDADPVQDEMVTLAELMTNFQAQTRAAEPETTEP